MFQVIIAAAIISLCASIPTVGDVCKRYQYMYEQCLPPTNWICDKLPPNYINLTPGALELELQNNPSYFHYIQTCTECIGEPYPDRYKFKLEYRKNPVCREVRTLVNHIYRPVRNPITDVVEGTEVCEVVLNDPPKGGSVQKIYRVDCVNGNPKSNDNKCSFDYGTFENYYCRPTNYVKRTMLIYCPSDKGRMRYHVEKMPTACSCVKVGCAAPGHAVI